MHHTSIAVNREWLDKLQTDKAALEQANDILTHELIRVRELLSEPDYEITGEVLAAAKELTNG